MSHVLVDAVNRRAQRAELHDFARDAGEESAVGRAAGRRQRRRDAGDRRHRGAEDVDQPAARREERRARQRPFQLVVEAVRVEHWCTRAFNCSAVDSVEKRKLNMHVERRRE